MTEPVLDVEAIEEEPGLELEPRTATNLFGSTEPVEVVRRATEAADALSDVIQAKGLFTKIQGSDHVRVEGWTLLGSMLGVTAVCVETEPVDGGYKATVEARTADGRVVGRADALCTKHEQRGPWKKADDYARLSMAQTRATSKALKGPLGFVVSLAGYSPTPAEEMTFVAPDAPAPGKTASEGGDVPSAKQLNFIVSLARELGADGGDQELLRAYSATNLTRGQGTAALDALQGKVDDLDPADALVRFVQKATEWAAKDTDLPADSEGLDVD